MSMKEFSFEEVKGYLYNCNNDITRYLNNNSNADLRLLMNFAIEDIEGRMNGEDNRKLYAGDIDYAVLISLQVIYLVCADKFEDIDRFATMWAILFKNYLQAFPSEYPREDYLLGLINLLELKNNMARLIFLSDYAIENTVKNNYLTVSQTYIDTILEKDINCEPCGTK